MEGFRRKRLFFHEKRHSVWAKILFTVVNFQLYYFIDLPWIEPIDGG